MALTRAQIQQTVDDKLATLWAAIQARQDSYAAAHGGRYWQGLRTHTVCPSEGTESTPDIGTTCPTDQTGAPWPAAIRTASLPMVLMVDCYEAPGGPGYQSTVEVTIAGATWRRTAQVGPEPWRHHGWLRLDDAP